jgi:polysaccharide deacetylase family protein (PEP-CTERM system associated)
MPYHILLTIDVEDWFQVENLKSAIPFESWPTRELRVERNTHKLLDLFDEVKVENTADSRQNTEGEGQTPTSCNTKQRTTYNGQQTTASNQQSAVSGRALEVNNKSSESCKSCLTSSSPRIRATFFVLGWIGERLPNLVREIHSRGHEVASHGLHHKLSVGYEPQALRRDLENSKKLLEDIVGGSISGYRAPSFSIDESVLRLIGESGYRYDSSLNSFTAHGRYGIISSNGRPRKGIAILLNRQAASENRKFYELPISNLPLFSFPILGTLAHFRHFRHSTLPWGGGAYFRLMPFWLFKRGAQRIMNQDKAFLFYIHPWEVDPEQPRVKGISLFHRFRHYTNLKKTYSKLSSFLENFSHCRFVSCTQYLKELNGQTAAVDVDG